MHWDKPLHDYKVQWQKRKCWCRTHEDGLAEIKPSTSALWLKAAILTDKEHWVGPHNEIWKVQPFYDVVVKVGTLESPRIICREGDGEEQSQRAPLLSLAHRAQCRAHSKNGWLRDCTLTSAGGRGDADADEVLECDGAGQKAAVLGPDLRNGFSSASIQDGDQPAGMNHGIEIHSLTDYINWH